MQYPEKRKPHRFQENILVRGREVLNGELPTEGEASPPSDRNLMLKDWKRRRD